MGCHPLRPRSLHLLQQVIHGGEIMRSIAVSVVLTAALTAPICGNPVMAEAMGKARATLPEFLALARAPRPSTTDFAVKVAVRDGGNTEFFWITPFKERD